MPAFQLIETIGVGGEFGTSPFGVESFGGSGADEWILPTLQVPSDDMTEDDRVVPSEITHRRHGAVVGNRVFAMPRRWAFVVEAIERDVVDQFKFYHAARRFYLLQDGSSSDRKVEVFWRGPFNPERLRGPYWTVEGELEEVIS